MTFLRKEKFVGKAECFPNSINSINFLGQMKFLGSKKSHIYNVKPKIAFY